MLNLSTKLSLDQDMIDSPNLTDRFSAEDLASLGLWCWEGYQRDKQSRAKWEKRNEAAMDLAMQIQKDKNFPWPNSSNVAFPLVTIAVLQFHARAYPAIIEGTDVVKYRVIGKDPQGLERARADRVSAHMSWQLLEQDEDWEEQHDRLLIHTPVVGCAFKKTYFSGSENYNESELVMAKDLVLDYWAKSVETCPRKTHLIPMFRNELYERVKRKIFRGILEDAWYQAPPAQAQTNQQAQSDNRTGITKPVAGDETTPFNMLEQHCLADFDGDGYAEPYTITLEESSKTIVRIVSRFNSLDDVIFDTNGAVISIRANEHFTKYPFIPSPDGGIYDIGFGVLLGPLNESTNSLINQLIDAGTMSVTAGGFLGRGAKIRGGVYTFAPLEWKRVDSTGDDLSKSIYPLPVREPSAVLFQLLSLLINYTQRISGSTDMMVGENPGQNTPAETSRAMIEQGMKIYNAIFKRMWRSMKKEFRKLYMLNTQHMPASLSYGEEGLSVTREDYQGNPANIAPVADPNITSDAMRFQQAQALKAGSMSAPGYNRDEVERRYLRALRVDAIDQVFPGSDKVPAPMDIKLQLEQLRQQGDAARLAQEKMLFVGELMEQHRLNSAKILELQAKAVKAVEDIQGDQRDREINAINTAIGVFNAHNTVLNKRIELLLKAIESDRETATNGGSVSSLAGNGGDQDAAASAALLEAPAAGGMGVGQVQ